MKTFARLLGTVLALAVLALIMALLAGFFEPKIGLDQTSAKTDISAYDTITVEAVLEPLIEQATGSIRAKHETVMSARITATIASINVRAGDAVAAGEALISLDRREWEARLQQQQQAVNAAQARVAAAQPNYDRIKELFDRKVASRADLDRVQAELRTAQALLGQAQRGLDEAKTNLSYSVISASSAGRVNDRYADPGDTAIPGVPLLKLYDPKHLRLEAHVRETLASSLHKGDQLRARIDALNQEFAVSVDEIVPSADPGSRSFLVKVTLPATPNLYPGMFGRLLIPSGSIERLYISSAAISQVGQLEYVSVLSDSGTARRFIRSGKHRPQGQVEVLSGLTVGEQVLLPAVR